MKPVTGKTIDRFIPRPDIIEQHQIRVRAPVALTFQAACELPLLQSRLVRFLGWLRAVLLMDLRTFRAPHPELSWRYDDPGELLRAMLDLGWGILAARPGREIVLGAVTQPWRGQVRFRRLLPDQFIAFREPGYVKIAWTIEADPFTETRSLFRTETRAVSTDPVSRRRFRRYWRIFSPGVVLIRRAALRMVKTGAERLAARDAAGNPAATTAVV